MTMHRFAIGALLVVALAAAMPVAKALTPTQSTAAAIKAKDDMLARIRAQALVKAKADAAAKARIDAAAKTKIKIHTLFTVRAETTRRIEAATKAAEANAQVTSFHATSSGPHTLGHGPGKLAIGVHHTDADHGHHHSAEVAEHQGANAKHAR
jgi:hypothetical protein